jgi:hypothetical protein
LDIQFCGILLPHGHGKLFPELLCPRDGLLKDFLVTLTKGFPNRPIRLSQLKINPFCAFTDLCKNRLTSPA